MNIPTTTLSTLGHNQVSSTPSDTITTKVDHKADQGQVDVVDLVVTRPPLDDVTRRIRIGLGKAVTLLYLTSQRWVKEDDYFRVDNVGKQALLAMGHYADQILAILEKGFYGTDGSLPPVTVMIDVILTHHSLADILPLKDIALLATLVEDYIFEEMYCQPTGDASYIMGPRPFRLSAQLLVSIAPYFRRRLLKVEYQAYANMGHCQPEGQRLGVQAYHQLFRHVQEVQPQEGITFTNHVFPKAQVRSHRKAARAPKNLAPSKRHRSAQRDQRARENRPQGNQRSGDQNRTEPKRRRQNAHVQRPRRQNQANKPAQPKRFRPTEPDQPSYEQKGLRPFSNPPLAEAW